MSSPRPLFAAIGATQESARVQIAAVGPASPLLPPAVTGDVLTWDGTDWVPAPGAALGVDGGLIFRPGGVPGIGVVTTEAALQAAIAQAPGSASVIFDDSIVSPIHLTLPWTVVYDMRWFGRGIGFPTHLVLDDGFLLIGPSGRIGISSVGEGLNVRNQGVAGPSPLTLTAVTDTLSVAKGSSLTSAGAGFPLLQIGSGSNLVLNLGGTLGDSLEPVIGFGASSTLLGLLYDFSIVSTNALRGTSLMASAAFSIVSPAITSLSLVHPSFSGTVTSSLASLATRIFYNDLAFTPPLNTNNVQGAIDALKTLVEAGGGSTAIWRGTGAPTAPGIFNSWASLFAWANSAPGSKHIYLDSTYGPLQVPSGLWTFIPPVEFIGSPVDPRTNLSLNEASFRNVWRWTRIKFIELNILTVPFGNFPETMEFNDCDLDMSGGAQPFIRTLNSAMDVTFRHMAVYPTTQLVFDMLPTAPPCTIRLYDGTTVAINSFSSAVGTTLTIIQDTTSVYVNQFFVMGTLIRQLASPAYIPSVPANWVFPPPTTTSDALDRIAAKFVALALGPV